MTTKNPNRANPTNSGANANIGGGMDKGSGKIGSLSQLNRKASHGSGSKGTLKSLLKGTGKTGKQPAVTNSGPLRKR